MNSHLPRRTGHFGAQRLRRMLNLFLAAPLVIAGIVSGWYFLLWRADPLIRFSHMLWTLGFWMMGTLAMFAVIITARQKSGASMYLMVVSLAAIALAVYFTPLSRFTNLFPTQASLILPASIGALNLLTSWLIAFRLRNNIAESQMY
ncbi:hypothetical protein [Roseiflexus sp.]|uniref:hypothetical protein n=1 Tax=Roseiflexus sp. TaxID=2562120 RepID=UPI0021DC7ABE|nr:hypothetical protein [Roseiflexus sp.]GIV98609.1 MAG: hypothetical protein KatS3mg058_0013 [Roseiflexus sp.]